MPLRRLRDIQAETLAAAETQPETRKPAKRTRLEPASATDSESSDSSGNCSDFVVSDSEPTRHKFSCICQGKAATRFVDSYKGRVAQCIKCGKWVHADCFNLDESRVEGFECLDCDRNGPRNLTGNAERGAPLAPLLELAVAIHEADIDTFDLIFKNGKANSTKWAERPLSSNNNRTLVHSACAFNTPDILRTLLLVGTRSNQRQAKRKQKDSESDCLRRLKMADNSGMTPLHLASIYSFDCLVAIKEILNSLGASRNNIREILTVSDGEGYSPLCRSVLASGDSKCIRFLIEWMKDVGFHLNEMNSVSNSDDDVGANRIDSSLVYLAARVGRGDVFQLCESNFGALVCQELVKRTETNATVLHYAAASAFILRSENSFECVKYIVDTLTENRLTSIIEARDTVEKQRGGRSAALYAVGSGVPWPSCDRDSEEFDEDFFVVAKSFLGNEYSAEIDNTEGEDVIGTDQKLSILQSSHEKLEWEEKQVKDSVLLRVVELLIDAGISTYSQEPSGASLLHLAAAHGLEQIVKYLLKKGVSPTVKDNMQWTPLIWAHIGESFDQVSDGSLMALLEADPHQLNELMSLMKGFGHDKVVKRLLKSLAVKPKAYKFVNEFLRSSTTANYEILEWFSVFPGLLDFANKQSLFRRVINSIYSDSHQVIIAKSGSEFISAFDMLKHNMNNVSITARFEGSIGGGAGVTREFWDNLSLDMIQKKYGVFAPFGTTRSETSSSGTETDILFFAPDTCYCSAASDVDSLDLTRFAGSICALAILNGQILSELKTLSSNIYRILIEDSIHFEWTDFETLDPDLFKSWTWMMQNHIDKEMELTFSFNELKKNIDGTYDTITKRLSKEYAINEPVTDENKANFVKLSAKYRIKKYRYKIVEFREGFTKLIPQKILKLLRPTDLELILCGIPVINVSEWRQATVYPMYSNLGEKTKQLAGWFWSVVEEDMSEADRVLLLKFSTGTSRTPLGGFLNGSWSFQLSCLGSSSGNLPSASTCFNLLKLPNYLSRDQLREKLLLAIRHGSTGFEFV